MMGMIRTAAGILALFWMCIIFAFSAQGEEESELNRSGRKNH